VQLLGHETFQANSGGLDNFKKHHGITGKILSVENNSV